MALFWRAIALSLLAAVLVAGCQPEGRPFRTTLQTDSNNPLPVTLVDETMLVTEITQAAADTATTGIDPALQADQDDSNALVLTWLGGACDADAAVTFHVLNGGYVLNLAVHEKLGLGCTANGVPRAIRIATSHPIPIASVTVAGG